LGMPRQLILEASAARPRLSVVSVSEEGLAAALSTTARQGFDVASEPPLRAHLFTLGEREHVLLLLLHHIAGDGWSMAPLVRDVASFYAARCRGSPADLPALPVQYADYTLWQNTLLGEESDLESVISRQLAYWTDRLEGLPEQLDLPLDRPRPAVSSYRGDIVPLILGPELHGGLLALARDSGASLFMVLQAGLAALLTRLGAGTDIPIGSGIAGRTDSVLDDLVGFFVNTLVLRTDTSGNPSFRKLIGRVRTSNLSAYSHQDLPFERLVEVINPARSLSRHPLFSRSTLPIRSTLATPRTKRPATRVITMQAAIRSIHSEQPNEIVSTEILIIGFGFSVIPLLRELKRSGANYVIISQMARGAFGTDWRSMGGSISIWSAACIQVSIRSSS
jgi:Condensation domain